MTINEIQLNNGSGTTRTTINNIPIGLRTRFNYSAKCWALDILDSADIVLAAGIMLIPYENLLHPYPALAEKFGVLLIDETSVGAYQVMENLGTTVRLMQVSL